MATLTITRGLPGSGKTTWAVEQLRTDALRAARINRDELRRVMHGGPIDANWAERQVTIAQHAAVAGLLRAAVDVICDDTNLSARVVRELARIATTCGADFEIKDFTGVPLETCIARDAARSDAERVGEEVIRGMWQRYFLGRPVPLPLPEIGYGITPVSAPASVSQPAAVSASSADSASASAVSASASVSVPASTTTIYRPARGLPEALLVDIDGTVALMGQRSPYDMSRVGDDRPNLAVITAVRAMYAAGHHIVFCTGRSEDAREATERWLATNVDVPYEGLYMRRTGDSRPDSVVKAQIFEREIRHRYRVTGVFDDRNQVVRMWRSLGLTVFQVADGDF